MLVDRADINYLHWQLKVDFGQPADGEIVAQIADIEQEIANLVLTPKGSVPLNPEKGCDLLPYKDLPPEIGIPNMVREVWDGLTVWCKRIIVEDVQVEMVDFHHWKIPVFWRPVEAVLNEILRTEVTWQPEAAS